MHSFTENQEYLQVTRLAVEQSRSLNQFQRIKYHKYHSQTLIQLNYKLPIKKTLRQNYGTYVMTFLNHVCVKNANPNPELKYLGLNETGVLHTMSCRINSI